MFRLGSSPKHECQGIEIAAYQTANSMPAYPLRL